MKIRDKNPEAKALIETLHKHGIENPLWKAVARGLNRPHRVMHEVNVFDIEKTAKAKEIIVVPGVVLGAGGITKPVEVAAYRFVKSAKEKIEKAGGKCFTLEELLERNPKGSRIRIMG